MKKNILWISPYVPYDKVGHGGGQNHNYYLKYFHKLDTYNIHLITTCEPFEIEKVDLKSYKIKYDLGVVNRNKVVTQLCRVLDWINIFRYGGLMGIQRHYVLYNLIHNYYKRNEKVDIIIMQWSEIVLMIDILKRYFPNCKYVAIEEDVAYVGYERKYKTAKGVYRYYKELKYFILKRNEVKCLKCTDLIVTLNTNDSIRLIKAGIKKDKVFQSCSFYGFYKNAAYSPSSTDLLYYGAMDRQENHESVIWFIEKVFSRMRTDYRLVIIGARPREELLRYQCERIVIKGFVENVQSYLESSLCLVSPLIMGAGIKIKILEALSVGIPVVTNHIGEDGIGLTNNVNYIHCEEPDEYIVAIDKLRDNIQFRNQIGANGKDFVLKHFNINEALKNLDKKIGEVCEKY